MHLAWYYSDVIDTDGVSQPNPGTYHFDFKDKTWWVGLWHGFGISGISCDVSVVKDVCWDPRAWQSLGTSNSQLQ